MAVLVATVVCAAGTSAVLAGTTWDGGGIDTNFTTSANWDDGSAPTFTEGASTLTFGTGGSTATVDTAANLARIILNRDATFTIADGSGSLTLQGVDVGGVVTGITAGAATAGTTVTYSISEQITLGQSQAWNVSNNGTGTTSLSVSGVISGAGRDLTKLGTGTLTLSGTNTFSGSLTVAGGALSINSWNNKNTNGPLGNSASPIVLGSATSSGMLVYTGANSNFPSTLREIQLAAGGGVVRLGGSGRDNGFVHLSGSSISGSGPLTIDSPGMVRFLIVGSSTFGGPVTVQAGELQVNAPIDTTVTVGGGSNGLGSAVTVNAGAIFTAWGTNSSAAYRLGSLVGAGTVRSEGLGTQSLSVGGDGTSTTFSGVIQNSRTAGGLTALTKVGSGMLTLSGSNSYSGVTTVNAGVLALGGPNALAGGGNLAFGGGTLQFSSNNKQDLSSRIKSSGSAIAIDTNSQSVAFASAIDSTNIGGLAKLGSGTLTLSGSNTFSGNTSINAGGLVVNGVLGTGTVNVAAGAFLSGSGAIGGPVLVLSGGIVAPGNSPGTLTVNNEFTLADTSLLNFELNPIDTTIGGGINDLITGVTNLTLDGILNISGTGDWTTVANNTSWRLFNYTGTLTNNSLSLGTAPTLGSGQSFQIDTATAGQVNLVIVPEPGALALAGAGLVAGLAVWRRRPRAA